MSAGVVIPPLPTAVAQARALVRRTCAQAGVPGDAADSAELLTSELVTNAIVHGRSEARLRVKASARCVHVEVDDDNSRHPHLQVDDVDALDGRGLQILQVAASRWGVHPAGIGKTVWFEVDISLDDTADDRADAADAADAGDAADG